MCDEKYQAGRSDVEGQAKLWQLYWAETRHQRLWNTLFELTSGREPLEAGRCVEEDKIWKVLIPSTYQLLQLFDATLKEVLER
jgi:hypothetical protein